MNSSTALRAAQSVKDPDKRRLFLHQYKTLRVREQIQSCTACPLHETRRNAVPWSGPSTSDIALVGEAPGANEDRSGIPFKGKAGALLDKSLAQAGLDRDSIFVFNTICCRPPRNRAPGAAELQACRPNFEAQLKISGAWLVIVAGNAALYSTLNMSGISKYRGKPIWQDGRLWFPVKHPAYYLRNRETTLELVNDFSRVHSIHTGVEKIQVDLREWPLTIEGSDSDLVAAVRRQGWAFMWSNILEDRIALTKTEKTRVPKTIADLPRYSIDEMVRILMLGSAGKMRMRDLQRIHAAKKAFDGVIVQ
jgi:DNA polymerase